MISGHLGAGDSHTATRWEVKYGQNIRIGALLEKPNVEGCFVEVKNTTLARGKLALSPDAVTERDRKHLVELMGMVTEGHRAVMFYVASRADVTFFSPADDIDPGCGKPLRVKF